MSQIPSPSHTFYLPLSLSPVKSCGGATPLGLCTLLQEPELSPPTEPEGGTPPEQAVGGRSLHNVTLHSPRIIEDQGVIGMATASGGVASPEEGMVFHTRFPQSLASFLRGAGKHDHFSVVLVLLHKRCAHGHIQTHATHTHTELMSGTSMHLLDSPRERSSPTAAASP